MKKYLPIVFTMISALFACAVMNSSESVSKAVDNNSVVTNATASLHSGDFDIVSAKMQLAAEHVGEYIEMDEADRDKELDYVSNYIMDSIEFSDYEERLAEKNIYVLNIPDEYSGTMLGSAVDVRVNMPILCYYPAADCWGLYGRVEFLRQPNDEAKTLSKITKIDVGTAINHGGSEAFGFSIVDSKKEYTAALIKQYCRSASNDTFTGYYQETNNKKETGSAAGGVAFTMQDHYVITERNIDWTLRYSYKMTYDFMYVAFVGWYNGEFAKYDGNVENFYVHTWDTTDINSINIGTSTGGGTKATGNVSVSFTKNSNHYEVSGSQRALTQEYRDFIVENDVEGSWHWTYPAIEN